MQSSHLTTLLLLAFATLSFSLPHALPKDLITKRTITFRRSSIHFPSHFRSLLPSSGQQLHNLFPSHSQKSKPKAKKDTTTPSTAGTVTTKPFSLTIWNFLSSPQTALNTNETDAGEGEPSPAQLSIFRASPVGHSNGKVRRTFGFLRSAVPWGGKDESGDENDNERKMETSMMDESVGMKEDANEKDKNHDEKEKGKGAWKTAHADGHKHSHKQPHPESQKSTQPSPPLRITMAGFKSWFDDAKAKEEGMEGPPQNTLQKWFGWGKKM